MIFHTLSIHLQNKRYIIPNESVDTSTLTVNVKPNESSTTSDVYNLVDNVTNLTSTDRVYFLSETEDMRYEIRFGDDVIGRALGDGEVIDLNYLVTSGEEANGTASFTFIGKVTDSNGVIYSVESLDYEVAETAKFGRSQEDVESIKFNAPRYYSTQYRAVTAQDYETIVKKYIQMLRQLLLLVEMN